jgi:hypothetical protein
MGTIEEREDEISKAAELADVYLKTHKDTLIMTSRNLITGKCLSLLFFLFSSLLSYQDFIIVLAFKIISKIASLFLL